MDLVVGKCDVVLIDRVPERAISIRMGMPTTLQQRYRGAHVPFLELDLRVVRSGLGGD